SNAAGWSTRSLAGQYAGAVRAPFSIPWHNGRFLRWRAFRQPWRASSASKEHNMASYSWLGAVLFFFVSHACWSQEAVPVDDWQSARTNQEGKEYPKVNSEGRVMIRVKAPDATSVTCSFRDSSDFTKDEDG